MDGSVSQWQHCSAARALNDWICFFEVQCYESDLILRATFCWTHQRVAWGFSAWRGATKHLSQRAAALNWATVQRKLQDASVMFSAWRKWSKSMSVQECRSHRMMWYWIQSSGKWALHHWQKLTHMKHTALRTLQAWLRLQRVLQKAAFDSVRGSIHWSNRHGRAAYQHMLLITERSNRKTSIEEWGFSHWACTQLAIALHWMHIYSDHLLLRDQALLFWVKRKLGSAFDRWRHEGANMWPTTRSEVAPEHFLLHRSFSYWHEMTAQWFRARGLMEEAILIWVKDRLTNAVKIWQHVIKYESTRQQGVARDVIARWAHISDLPAFQSRNLFHISRTELSADNERQILFVLKFNRSNLSLELKKRYQEFENLHKALLLAAPDIFLQPGAPQLAAKGFSDTADPHLISCCKTELERYLRDVLSIPRLASLETVISFCSLSK